MADGEQYKGHLFNRREFLRVGGVGLAGAGLLGSSACGGGSQSSSGSVTLTFWSWVPHIENEIKLFEKTHPKIKIKYVNAGQGTPEYTKLKTALKSGSGAPDVVQIEFQYLRTFEQINGLQDISKYGASKVKNDFVPWAWEQVSEGSKVYAIPQDSGPMGLLYRKDIFDKYGLKVPETWDEFAQEAEKLHKANPNIFMTDFAVNDGGWVTGLLWQAGSRPFRLNGNNLTININDAGAKKVAEYWQRLIDGKLVDTAPDFNNEWYSALDRGKYAVWVSAAWGPVFLSGIAKKSKGKWRAAPLPQWRPGEHISANWGGSTSAVTAQSQHPEEATKFAIWLNSNMSSAKMLAYKSFLFPTLKGLLDSPSFRNKSYSFYGGQQVNKVFVDSSEHVDLGFQWSPFQDYVYTQMTNQFGKVSGGKITLSQAFDNLQGQVVKYAKSQGFKVQE